jgi:hypothetical protein
MSESEAIEVHDADSLGLAILMVLFCLLLGTLLLWCFAALATRYQVVKTQARVFDRAEASGQSQGHHSEVLLVS